MTGLKKMFEKFVRDPRPDPDLEAAQRSMAEAQRRLETLQKRLTLQQRWDGEERRI